MFDTEVVVVRSLNKFAQELADFSGDLCDALRSLQL